MRCVSRKILDFKQLVTEGFEIILESMEEILSISAVEGSCIASVAIENIRSPSQQSSCTTGDGFLAADGS